jgi:hypothetical protein
MNNFRTYKLKYIVLITSIVALTTCAIPSIPHHAKLSIGDIEVSIKKMPQQLRKEDESSNAK